MRPSTIKSRINELEACYTSASEHVGRLPPSGEGVPRGVGGENQGGEKKPGAAGLGIIVLLFLSGI